MRVSVFIFIGWLALSLTACSFNKLDREEAKMLIEDFYEYPNVETAEFSLDLNLTGIEPHQRLIDDGYLIFSQYSSHLGISEKGFLYKGEEKRNVTFATNLRYFKEITGIRYENDDKTKAIVEFDIERRNITPFGEQKGYNEGDIEPYHVEFQKYDDGWRVTTKNKGGNKLQEDFPDVEEFK